MFSELKTIWSFFKKTPRYKRRIVFYAEHRGYYTHLEGLVETLTKEYKESLAYVTSDESDPILSTKNTLITPFYINRLLPFFMRIVDCDVFVLTLTELDLYHIKRSFQSVHYVYVFHALVSTHMVFRPGSYDNYDAVLCVGPHHIEEIRKHEEMEQLKPKELIKAGYYPLERLHNAYKLRDAQATEQKTVLIAPSWGDGNILESVGVELISKLLEADYRVLVRPHFETIKHDQVLLDSLKQHFAGNQNFEMVTKVKGDDLLIHADVLIGDWSGVSLKYAFGTERPVVYIDVPTKVKNPDYEKLGIEPLELKLRSKLGHVVSIDAIDTVPEHIRDLMQRKDEYGEKIRALREQYVFNFGTSSEVGAAYIMNYLSQNAK